MKQYLLKFPVVLFGFQGGVFGAAPTGELFNITETGNALPQTVQITLCLNAAGPTAISCQNYGVNTELFNVKTTIPNRVYPNAGIRTNTPGYNARLVQGTLTLVSQPKPTNTPGYLLFQASSAGNNFTFSSTPPTPPIDQGTPYAYVGDFSNMFWSCSVTKQTGVIDVCQGFSNNPAFQSSAGMGFLRVNNVPYAYVADTSQPAKLYQCPLDKTTGGVSGNCNSLFVTSADPSYPPTSRGVDSVTFQTFGSQLYAYLPTESSGSNGVVYQCAMDAQTGQFTSAPCNALLKTAGTPFNKARSVVFQSVNGTSYAYVTDATNTVWKCATNNNGTWSTCSAASTAFNTTLGLALRTYAGNIYAYVGDFSTTFKKCPVNADGSFGACSAFLTLSSPEQSTGISFKTISQVDYAYLGSFSKKLYSCPINAQGDVSSSCNAFTNSAFNKTIFVGETSL